MDTLGSLLGYIPAVAAYNYLTAPSDPYAESDGSDPYAESDPNAPETLFSQIVGLPGDLLDAAGEQQRKLLEAARKAAEEAARIAAGAQKAWWSWMWDAALAPFRLAKRVLYGLQDYALRGAQMLGDGVEAVIGVRLGTGLLIAAPFGLALTAMWIWGALPLVPAFFAAATRLPIRAIEVLGAPLVGLAKMMI
jgi:hypothetical protein